LTDLFDFMIQRQETIITSIQAHTSMVLTALSISVTLGLVLGYLITYNKAAAKTVIYICGILMTIPSLALFVFLIPFFGIGAKPATVGLVIYTLLPIVRNVYVGLTNIDPAVISAARGMGMREGAITLKIKMPLALPVVFAGIRTAVVLGIGLGAIAAYIGAGGLGVFIFQGINRGNDHMVLTGALLISLLTVIIDRILYMIQRRTERMVR